MPENSQDDLAAMLKQVLANQESMQDEMQNLRDENTRLKQQVKDVQQKAPSEKQVSGAERVAPRTKTRRPHLINKVASAFDIHLPNNFKNYYAQVKAQNIKKMHDAEVWRQNRPAFKTPGFVKFLRHPKASVKRAYKQTKQGFKDIRQEARDKQTSPVFVALQKLNQKKLDKLAKREQVMQKRQDKLNKLIKEHKGLFSPTGQNQSDKTKDAQAKPEAQKTPETKQDQAQVAPGASINKARAVLTEQPNFTLMHSKKHPEQFYLVNSKEYKKDPTSRSGVIIAKNPEVQRAFAEFAKNYNIESHPKAGLIVARDSSVELGDTFKDPEKLKDLFDSQSNISRGSQIELNDVPTNTRFINTRGSMQKGSLINNSLFEDTKHFDTREGNIVTDSNLTNLADFSDSSAANSMLDSGKYKKGLIYDSTMNLNNGDYVNHTGVRDSFLVNNNHGSISLDESNLDNSNVITNGHEISMNKSNLFTPNAIMGDTTLDNVNISAKNDDIEPGPSVINNSHLANIDDLKVTKGGFQISDQDHDFKGQTLDDYNDAFKLENDDIKQDSNTCKAVQELTKADGTTLLSGDFTKRTNKYINLAQKVQNTVAKRFENVKDLKGLTQQPQAKQKDLDKAVKTIEQGATKKTNKTKKQQKFTSKTKTNNVQMAADNPSESAYDKAQREYYASFDAPDIGNNYSNYDDYAAAMDQSYLDSFNNLTPPPEEPDNSPAPAKQAKAKVQERDMADDYF